MLLKYNPFKKALHYVYLSFFILLCLVVSTNSETKEESDDSHQEISQPSHKVLIMRTGFFMNRVVYIKNLSLNLTTIKKDLIIRNLAKIYSLKD